MIVAPSLLACPKERLLECLKEINQSDARYIHIDVMDGQFVPNQAFDDQVVKVLRPKTNKILDVHLMMRFPQKAYQKYIDAGADIITFHVESQCNTLALIHEIKEKYPNIKVGLSLKPQTATSRILPFLPYLDLVLVMSVEPGFGGQAFMETSLDKLEELVFYRQNNDFDFLLSVDGGINETTYQKVRPYVDIVVAGTYLFKDNKMNEKIKKMIGE